MEKNEKKLTPEKVMEMFKVAEDWNDIRQIMVNVNYYVGNQWIGWNRSERRIQMLPVYEGQERITLNKIRPRVMTLLSKHTKNKIKYDVIPSSKEQQDIDAAKAANKYLQFLWNDMDFNTKTRDIFMNMLIKKRCWVKTWFDAEAGDDITPEEGQPGYEKDMNPIHTGVIRARVCDPLTIFVDPAATTEEEVRWIIERKARDVDEINAEYGKSVTADEGLDYLNSYDVTRVNSDGIATNEVARKKNMALVYEAWMKPCKNYPNGYKITVCNNQTIDEDDKAGELPYHLFGYIPIPGNLNFDSIITDMIPVQRGINIKRSMIATHAKRVGNTLWLIPMGSGTDEEELSNEEGGFVHYNAVNGAKPERAPAPDIPSFYDRDLANDSIDLDDMSGSREVSQGSMPKGLDTLGGLQIMVEQENEKLAVGAMNYEQGMKKVMQRILRLMKKHYTEERQAKIIGEDNEIELISFNASDLSGGEDIKVIEGSSLPEMKAAQQERIMLMWSSGAIVKKDGTPDPTALLRLMGMGDSTDLFEQHELDENKAKLENKTFEDMAEQPEMFQVMAQYQQQKQYVESYNQQLQVQAQEQGLMPEEVQGMLRPMPAVPKGMPQVRDFQDHEVHIYLHNSFRKSGRYDDLPPEVQQMVDAHVAEHEKVLMAPMMQQMQQEQALAQSEQQSQKETQEAQSQEADKNREHQTAMKQADLQAKAQSEQLKGNIALQTASLKNSGRL